MADNFDRAMDLILDHEGGLVDDPRDPGGLTKYGISQRAYPKVNIRALTWEQAKNIYRADYAKPLRFDEMPWAVGVCLLDCGINQGVGAAARTLQRALGVTQDGVLGPVTMAALAKRDPKAVAAEFQAQRIMAYAGMSNWKVYGLGWARRAMATLAAAVG